MTSHSPEFERPIEYESFSLEAARIVEQRPQETMLAYLRNTFSDERYLQNIFRKGVFHRIAALLPETLNAPLPDGCNTPEGAMEFVAALDTFYRRLDPRNERLFNGFVGQRVRAAYRLLLIAGGAARASVWQDWRVERDEAQLSERLGVRSMMELEAAWSETYAPDAQRSVHFVKGPGDGRTPVQWEQERKIHISTSHGTVLRQERWSHVGMGDRLYFDIGPILERFIKTDPRQSPREHARARIVVDVLSYALQHRLREQWTPFLRRQQPHPTGPKGKKSGPHFFDLNQIFSLLRDPTLFDDIEEMGHILTSDEFVDDGTMLLDKKTQRWIAGFRGGSSLAVGAQGKIAQRRSNYVRMLFQRRALIEEIIEEMKTKDLPMARARVIGDQWEQWTGGKVSALNKKRLLELYRTLLKEVKMHITSSTASAEARAEGPRLTQEQWATQILSALRQYFLPEFVQAVENKDQYASQTYYQDLPLSAPDLNTLADFEPHQFIPGYFERMPDLLGPEAQKGVSIMSSVRSDSHEDDAAWDADIRGNLPFLAPGGILITDGQRESYSRVQRLISDLPEGYRQFWAVQNADGAVHSLVIQRQPNSGDPWIDVPNSRINGVFSEGVALQDPFEVMHARTDLQVLNGVRRGLVAKRVLKGREDFAGLQSVIENEVRDRLLRTLLCNTLANHPGTDAPRIIVESMQTGLRNKIEELLRQRDVSDRERPLEREKIRLRLGFPEKAHQGLRPIEVERAIILGVRNVRNLFLDAFDATPYPQERNEWQVKEIYHGLIQHAMKEAVRLELLQGAPQEDVDRLLWRVASGQQGPPLEDMEFEDRNEVIDTVIRDVIRRVRQWREAQRAERQ